MTMNRIPKLLLSVALAVAIAPVAQAATDDEATITVVEEGETPDDVVKVIALPERAATEGKTKSASGIDTANSAKDKSGSGRELGEQVSAEARDMADEKRNEAADQARNDARNDNAGGANRHGPH
jgi:hypothetical protein